MIASETTLADDQWKDIVDRVPHATYFDCPEWYRVWQQYSGLPYECLAVELKTGKQVLLPYQSQPVGKHRKPVARSSAAGTFGGFLCTEAIEEQEYAGLVNWVHQRFSNFTIRVNPYLPNAEGLTRLTGKLRVQSDFTQAIDLSPGFEACFKAWTKGHRSAAKKGIREGVSVRLANSTDDWMEYYAAYQDSISRWGDSASSVYRKQLFEVLADNPSQSIKLWIAEHGGTLITGCLCFYHGQHVVYWHGAGREEFFALKGVHVLQHHIIQDAIEQGFRWYDFNPSGGHEGVIKFKHGFATEKIPCPVLSPRQPWRDAARQAKRFVRSKFGAGS